VPEDPPGVAARVGDEGDERESTTVYANGQAVEVPAGTFARGAGPRVLVRFAGPVKAAWTRQLEATGAQVEFWCPPFGACVTTPATVDLSLLPFLRGAVPYEEQLCARPGIAVAGDDVVEGQLADVVCFDKGSRERVGVALRARGVVVLDEASSKLRIVAPVDLNEVRRMVGVKVVDPARPQGLTAVDADQLAASVVLAEHGAWPADLDGRGEVVAVTDTGLDTGVVDASLCRDFAGRVASLRSWPINPTWSAFVSNPGNDDGAGDAGSGHGTYIAGLVLGDGSLSGGRHRGLAPAARLVFQAIEQWADVDASKLPSASPGRYLAGRPLDLRDLFRASAGAGATIHVNAWGDAAHGAYTNDSYEADLFLREHPEGVVLFASGNGGADANADRVVDPGSVDAPATAKNVIAVGATEGPVYGVGYLGTWTGLQSAGHVFANVADRRDGVSGQPDRLALISACGPTADGRIRPDLCAPGTNLAGPRSTLASGSGWGYADPAPLYMYLGGTSSAVAVAGGALAVLRQAWRRSRRGRAPSGATLKAIVVAGAAAVANRAGDQPEARGAAGFGRVAVATSLPKGPDHVLHVLSDASRHIGTGGRHRWRVRLAGPGALRVVLTWYDTPNERLVNDLDLAVVTPTGTRYWGNHGPRDTGRPDRTNNLEVVDLASSEAGTYLVEVTGLNIPDGPQAYALVARGPIGSTISRGG
jgi:serine protease AprX